MNLTNFVQTGGFPVKAERLQELQTAFSVFNELGFLAGNLTILSGCNLLGTSISDGYVFINGEVLKFKAGFISADVIVIQNESAKEFENGEVKAVHYERYATFGTNLDASWPWESFKRPDPITVLMARISLLEKKTAIFTQGGVAFPWRKPANEIPAGFQECNDLRGKTIVGYDENQPEFNAIGKSGGAKNKTLSIAEMPAHSHTYQKAKIGRGYDFQDRTPPLSSLETADTSTVGSGQAFSILNPYRVVLFIEFIG
ncbi:phage baseplate protein [Flavobacterium frigoris]|uniref:Baseplate structural protein Gp10 C-terminal domain-containing protein n=1 Tax=Flavobacterium frigoris TaxID=229204 RepID=A0A1H9LMV8_FLAFI|nr:hypothetical protein [Flavobacterium frigoris]SER12756.1 hypothetical protein SAMN05444355_10778 [Flavobacterium frigoris]